MNRKTLFYTCVGCVFLAVVGTVAYFYQHQKKHVVKHVVSWVRGKPVYQEDITTEHWILKNLVEKQQGEIDEKTSQNITAMVQNTLENDAAVSAEAEALGVEVSEAEVIQEIKKQAEEWGGGHRVKAYMEAHAIDETYLKQRVKRHLLKEKVKNIRMGESVVSSEEAKRYYQDHQSAYVQPTTQKIRHIWVMLEEGASDERKEQLRAYIGSMRTLLMDGEDFEGMAQSHSNADDAEDGGDLGWVSFGDERVPKEVFALQEGMLSKVYENDKGLELYYVEDVRMGKTIPFKDVRAAIQKMLKEEKDTSKESGFMRQVRVGWD